MVDVELPTQATNFTPLAARMRPVSLAHFNGQRHILEEGRPLRRAIEAGQVPSMILWGPPGTGKTTLARLVSQHCRKEFVSISAVQSGVKQIRCLAEQAKSRCVTAGQGTVLFVDEVHRFSKSQQDAFLPFVEDGTLIFVGATTENPSFTLNSALLSRARVFVLQPLLPQDILAILKRAAEDVEHGLGRQRLSFENDVLEALATASDGDARRALNTLEILGDLCGTEPITREDLAQILQGGSTRRFDNQGDVFYDQISALHKSVRGSSPDAALYWLVRMLDGGCDPRYLARRLVRIASEDVGNADPRALRIALDAWDVQDRVGSPEGELALAQAVLYLSICAKSNAVYSAYNAVLEIIKNDNSHEVPTRFRNAPTNLMGALGYGNGYRYAHDEPDGYAAGETYFPDTMCAQIFYKPTDRGMEAQIRDKLAKLRAMDSRVEKKRR